MATGLALAGAAGLTIRVLHGQFGQIALASIGAAVLAQPIAQLYASLALTALSFVCLAVYDVAGARVVAPHRVPQAMALLAGVTGNAVSNTLGFHAVTGIVVRAYVYRRCGLTKAEVVRIVSLSWLALGLGFVTMFGASQLLRSGSGTQPGASLLFGGTIVASLATLLFWLAGGRRQLSVFGFSQPLPSAKLAMLQILFGAVESASAIGALYVLLPTDLAPPFSVFSIGCIAAVALGVVAHAPGGLGVFEASVTALLAGQGRADLLAALLVYRAIYNLLPFGLSCIALLLLPSNRVEAATQSGQFDGG